MAVPSGRLVLAKRFRFQWEDAQQAHVLLFPEGMVKLNDSAAEILALCDGTRDVVGIISDLTLKFPAADLTAEIHTFLEVAHGRGWITGS